MNWASNLHARVGQKALIWCVGPELLKNEAVMENIKTFRQNQIKEFSLNLGKVSGTLKEN